MPMKFDPATYETVADRISRFYAENPEGRITTTLLSDPNRNDHYIFSVSVYRNAQDAKPVATGHAQETSGGNNANALCACENSETSAIGRALANMNYSTRKENGQIQRPSREEMQKANREPSQSQPSQSQPTQRAQRPAAQQSRQDHWDAPTQSHANQADDPFEDGPSAPSAYNQTVACFKCNLPVRISKPTDGSKPERYNADGSLHFKTCGKGPAGFEEASS